MAPAAATGNQDVRPQICLSGLRLHQTCPAFSACPRKEAQDRLPSPLLHFCLPWVPSACSGPGLRVSWDPHHPLLAGSTLLRPGHPSTARCYAHRRAGSLRGWGSGVLVSWIDPLHLCQLVPCMGERVCRTPSRLLSSAWPLHAETRCWLQAWPGRPCAGSLHG